MNQSREIPQDIIAQYQHKQPIVFINNDTGFLVFQTESMSYTEETVGGYFRLFDIFRANHNQRSGVMAGDLIGFQFYLPPIQSAFSVAQKKKRRALYPILRTTRNFLSFKIPLHTLFLHVEHVYPGIKVHPINKDIWKMIRKYPAKALVPLL